MRYLVTSPEGQLKAAVILLAGGNGALRLGSTGTIGRLGGNFLIRSRELFARQGLFVAALDASSDNQSGMNGEIRLSAQHAQDIGRVIADVRTRTGGAAVWLVGTSAGTLSAANVAARLSGAEVSLRPAGVVLTSTMTTLGAPECGKTVYDAGLGDIRIPVLLVSHENDACPCSPGGSAVGSRLLAACSGAPSKEHGIFTGGTPPIEPPCEARTAHGYFGIEESVVEFIAGWIKSH
ncbi:MAG TPA: alpha/beta hydrolase [bacterium]